MGTALREPAERLRAALAGRYDLDREIGRGGMASVYRAYDRRHDRTVAVKVLRSDLAAALGEERFLREIRIAARLQHPNIVPLHDSGAADGFFYYVMPLVEGETLRDRIAREQQLPLDDATRIAREVAEALDYAHEHDVIHRDIKPGNILLSAGHAMVADFGVARAISTVDAESLTGSGIVLGTPEYMSPEQSTGESHLDGRSDIYALGCVLYEMLAGEPPFTGRTAQSILARQRQEAPRSLRIVRPGLPAAVLHAVDKALAKIPADRFSTAQAFAASLSAPTQVDSPPARFASWRRPAVIAAAACLLAAGAFLVTSRRTAPPTSVAAVVIPFDQATDAVNPTPGAPAHVLFAEALEWIPGLQAIDGSRLIPAGGSARASPLAGLLRGAAELGGKYLVTGTVLPWTGGLRVSVDVYAVENGERIVRAMDSAPRGALDEPVGRLALQSIGILANREELDLGARKAMFSSTSSTTALGHLLQGQASFTSGDYDAAAAAYRRAIEADSLCGLAYLRLSEVEGWRYQYGSALKVAEAGLRLRDRIPARWTNLLGAQRYAVLGIGDSAIAAFQDAVLDDRQNVDAWLGLGEALFHLGAYSGHSAMDALPAFERTVQLDSGFVPIYDHLVDLALYAGDSARAGKYVRRMPPNDPSRRVREAAILLRFGGADSRREAHEQLRTADRQALSQVIALWIHGSANLLLADTLAGYLIGPDRTPDDRRRGAQFRMAALAGQGRWSEGVAVWRKVAGDQPFDAWMVQAYLAGYPADQMAGPMFTWARSQLETRGAPDFNRPPWDELQQGFQAIVHRASLLGDSAEVNTLLHSIRDARPSRDSSDPAAASLKAALEARLALLGGDSTGAIALLRSALARVNEPYTWYYPMTSMAPQRRLLMDLLEKRGMRVEAKRWRDSFRNSWSVGDILFAARLDSAGSRIGR